MPPALEALRSERDRFAAMAFCWADLLVELDRTGTLAYVAGAAETVTGYTSDDLLGRPLRDLVMPADGPLISQLLKIAARRGRIDSHPVNLRRRDGSTVLMQLSGYALDEIAEHIFIGLRLSPPGRPAGNGKPVQDDVMMTDLEAFADIAGQQIKVLGPDAAKSAEMTLISFGDFEALRDRLDADTHDTLVQSLGLYLKSNAVTADLVAQVDEGRFSLLRARDVGVDDLRSHLTAISRQIDPAGAGLQPEVATVSLDDSESVDEIDLAKGLLYVMNRFRHSAGDAISLRSLSTNIGDFVVEAASEVNSFKSIVAERRFDVAFQPIISLKTGRIHHYEALCRFHDSAPGESPYRYIRFAEETGLIHEFDLAMASKVIDWLRSKPVNRSGYDVAVNLSGQSLQEARYVQPLLKLLGDNPWAQGKLMFEITESARISDLTAANAVIQSLRRRGYQVCLDDFGSGAASFEYLSYLDIDVIKLDGKAIKSAQTAVKGHAFMSALAELCGKLKIQTIAEMIDDDRGLDFVASCGCNYVQGYLFGRPAGDIRQFDPLPNANLIRRLHWRAAAR